MEEVWKDIPQYEGLYQISNFGSVRYVANRQCRQISVRGNEDYFYINLTRCGETRSIDFRKLLDACFEDHIFTDTRFGRFSPKFHSQQIKSL